MENSELIVRMDERQKALDEKFDIHQQTMLEKLDQILEQTTKTNGRVTIIENERLPKLEHWKSKIHGIYLAVAAVIAAITFIIGALIEFSK